MYNPETAPLLSKPPQPPPHYTQRSTQLPEPTPSHITPPKPTISRLEKLKKLDAALKAYTPVLLELLGFVLGTIGLVTVALVAVGAAVGLVGAQPNASPPSYTQMPSSAQRSTKTTPASSTPTSPTSPQKSPISRLEKIKRLNATMGKYLPELQDLAGLFNASKMHHLETAMHNVERAVHNLETAIDNLEAARHNSSAQPFSSPTPRPSQSYTHSSMQTTPPPPQKSPPTSFLEKVEQLNAICDTYDPVLESAARAIVFGVVALIVVGLAVGHPPKNYTQTLERQQPPKMALPKLKTASLAPPPPPTLLDRLNSLDANLRVYGPVLQRLFEFTMLTSLGTLAIVAVATALLGGSGFALYLLVQGAKMAIS
ncbi:hypothetical protein V500_08694 [Pseudogymnoascus sp. VKM F-4518 (FW-2643)]|nr:hypothetical protein V500_08694 [Pseudogymnoascus sp. VKM F-4518 (FW-2643)]